MKPPGHSTGPSCREVLKYICDDIDVAKNSRVCREIRAHLAECPHCSTDLRILRKTVRLYKTCKVRAPADLHKRVMESLRKTVLSR